MVSVQRIKEQGTVEKLSKSQIVCLITNLPDASKHLNEWQYKFVVSVYNLYRKETTLLPLDMVKYVEVCKEIISAYESQVPYFLFDGNYSEHLTEEMVADIWLLYDNNYRFDEMEEFIFRGILTQKVEELKGFHVKKQPFHYKNTSLHYIVQNFANDQSEANFITLSKVLKRYIDEGEWICVPTLKDDIGFQPVLIESNGKIFACLYTDSSEDKGKHTKIITDINKLITTIFEQKEIDGIAFNPETTCLCIEKNFLLKCILHRIHPQTSNGGVPKRNWGPGIPCYTENDIMTQGELLNFAIHTVLDNEDSLSKYQLVSACDHTEAVPNLIFESNGEYHFVSVYGYCAEEPPVILSERKEELLKLGKKYHGKCYYAPVGFRSANDLTRFNACIALRGDGFYVKYEGLQQL